MKKPDYHARKYIIRYKTLNNERLYFSKDGEIIEEPQLDIVDSYYNISDIRYNYVVKSGEKYNETHKTNPIISYEIAIMETEVYMHGTPNGAFIYFPNDKEVN